MKRRNPRVELLEISAQSVFYRFFRAGEEASRRHGEKKIETKIFYANAMLINWEEGEDSRQIGRCELRKVSYF